MEDKITSTKVLSNMLWRFAERWSAQLVTLVVSIVLARLLEPSDYGTIALLDVFIGILNVFVNSGMGTALIQRKNADDLDYSSMFYFNIVMCILLYLLLFACSPLIASFYGMPELTALTRVVGLTLIFSGIKSIQNAHISKTLQFKKFFYVTLIGTIISAIIGISMAYAGFGYWAIVAQSLTNTAIDTIMLWILGKWRPKKMFSFARLKGLFSFGWKILVSGLIDTGYGSLRTLIIGKIYSSSDLAYYNKGKSWPDLFITNVNSSIDSVLLPTMSAAQDNTKTVKAMTRRAIKTSTYVMAPLLMGLAFCGTTLVRLVLTEKWLPLVPFMTIFCITYMFYPVHTANLNAIKAMGRSDLFLKLEISKKIVGLIALAVTVPISVMAMGYSLLFTSVASQIINSWPNKKLLNYGYIEQLKDILPGILLAVAMGCCIYPIQWLGLPDIVTLCIQIPLGALIYICGSKLFKLESYEYLLNIIKPVFKRMFMRKNRKENFQEK